MGRYAERAEQRDAAGVLGAGMAGGAPDRQRQQRRLPAAAGKPCRYMGLLPVGTPAGIEPEALARAAHWPGGRPPGASPTPLSALVYCRAMRWLIHVFTAGAGHQPAVFWPAGAAAPTRATTCNAEALADLEQLAVELVAIAGEQADHMTRDDGWRFLAIGPSERLNPLAAQLGWALPAARRRRGPKLLLALFDSTLTYRSYYQCRQELPALLDLLVRRQQPARYPQRAGGAAQRAGSAA